MLAWHNIKIKLENNTGKVFGIKKLKKKWNNIQQRVKERNRLMKKTSGASPVKDLRMVRLRNAYWVRLTPTLCVFQEQWKMEKMFHFVQTCQQR